MALTEAAEIVAKSIREDGYDLVALRLKSILWEYDVPKDKRDEIAQAANVMSGSLVHNREQPLPVKRYQNRPVFWSAWRLLAKALACRTNRELTLGQLVDALTGERN